MFLSLRSFPVLQGRVADVESRSLVQDWKIYRRRQVFELLASLFQASRSDPQVRKLILQVRLLLLFRPFFADLPPSLQFLVRATALPTAARELLSRNGLLGWLAAQQPLDVAERRLLVTIVANVVNVLSFEEGKLAGVVDAVEALEAAIGSEGALFSPPFPFSSKDADFRCFPSLVH